MKESIKILEKLLSETTVSKYSTSAETMAARNILVKAIQLLNKQAALKNVDYVKSAGSPSEYFKSQKAKVNGNA